MSENKQVLSVVFSEEDLIKKIEEIEQQGYAESDLHIISQDASQLESIQNQSEAEIEEAGSFKDKFKGFITGEGSVREGIKDLGLSEKETERYTADVARGGILVYVDAERETITEVLAASDTEDSPSNPTDEKRQEFINSVDNNFDEQEDRFARGETFQQDPTLVKDEKHVSFTTQEDPEVEKARGGTSEAEKHTKSDKKY